MGKRSIDWEGVAKDYKANLLTVKEIAKKHDVGVSTIMKKAKEFNWIRDYTDDIKKSIKNKLIDAQIERSIPQAIEQAADETVAIILKHRRIIRDATNRSNTLDEKFDGVLLQIADLNDMSKAASIQKSLVEAKGKLIALERQAFNIEEDKRSDERIEDILARINA